MSQASPNATRKQLRTGGDSLLPQGSRLGGPRGQAGTARCPGRGQGPAGAAHVVQTPECTLPAREEGPGGPRVASARHLRS